MRAGLHRVCGSDPLKPSRRGILVQDHSAKFVARFDGGDSVGDMPCRALPTTPLPRSFLLSCVRLPSARLKIHALLVRHPTHDGGAAIGGERDGQAQRQCWFSRRTGAGADQPVALLRMAAARDR